jgi:hypothetical protein
MFLMGVRYIQAEKRGQCASVDESSIQAEEGTFKSMQSIDEMLKTGW